MSYSKIPDYHIHSEFSADCDSNINDIVNSARLKGLPSICFTDHYDLDFPDTPEHLVFDLDIDNYISVLSKLREETNDIDIRIGVEQGVMPSTCEVLDTYSKKHPGLDFIICSTHVVDNSDPYYPEFWYHPDGTKKDPEKQYQLCFENILYNVTHFHDYNVYGHLDYIFRYGPTDSPDFQKVNAEIFGAKYFPIYKEIIHEILKNIIDNGKGIEINTGSLYRGLDFAHPHIEILKMYKELGGEILTFGSDTHDIEHVGYGLDEAGEMAKSVGLKYYCTFKDMKPDFHSLVRG